MTALVLFIFWTLAAITAGVFLSNTEFIRKRRQYYTTNLGETLLRNQLVKSLNPAEYHILNNITVPHEDGSTQIDHIVVSKKGIFIVETKHYKGWIFGKENDKYWTQTFYKSKYKFQNPIRQNYKHLLAIREIIGTLTNHAFFSSVVFTGKAEFKTLIPKNVFTSKQLIETIKESPEIINKEQMMACIGKIEHARYEMTKETDIDHQNYLTNKFGKKATIPSSTDTSINKPNDSPVKVTKTLCIKCGNKGSKKDNEYWTCDLFPKCMTGQHLLLDKTRGVN